MSSSLPSVILPPTDLSSLTQTSLIFTSATGILAGILQCYSFADYENQVIQSIGFVPELCSSNGVFSQGYSALSSCVAAYNTPSYLCASTQDLNSILSVNSVLTLMNSGLTYCANLSKGTTVLQKIKRQTSSAVATLTGFNSCFEESVASIESSLCSVASREGVTRSQCYTTTTPHGSVISPATTAIAGGASATAGLSNGSNHLSGGAIAGVAIGAILAVLFIALGIVFFAYRRRKQRRAALAANTDVNEKAQLHSDDIKPDRKELIGTTPARQPRIVGGLTELPAPIINQDWTGRGELQANEVVGSELESSNATTAREDASQAQTEPSTIDGKTFRSL